MADKYLTPLDKSMRTLFTSIFDDDEDEKKRKLEEDKNKEKPELKDDDPNIFERLVNKLPAAKYYNQKTPQVPSQKAEDMKVLGGAFASTIIDEEGRIMPFGAGSDDPDLLQKIEILNQPSRVLVRRNQAAEPEETIDRSGAIERFMLGTSPLDTDPLVSHNERLIRKTTDAVIDSASGIGRAVTIAGARGGAFIPQLSHLVNKYGMGTLEYAARNGILGDDVDYDRLWSANLGSQYYSDEAEKFVKAVEDTLDVDDLNFSEKILMYTTEYAIPINVVGTGAKAIKVMGEVASDTSRLVRGLPRRSQDPLIMGQLKKAIPVLPNYNEIKARGKLEKAYREELKRNPFGAQSFRDFEKHSEIAEQMMKDRIELSKIIRQTGKLDAAYPKRGKLDVVGRIRDRLEYPEGTRKVATGARVITKKDGTEKIQKEMFIEQPLSYEQRLDKLTLKKVLNGQAVVGAGAISGAWDKTFEGTAYQDMSYMLGLAGAFATPSATTQALQHILDPILANKKFGVQFIGVPQSLYRLKDDIDDVSGQIVQRPLNLMTLLYGFGKVIGAEKRYKLDPDQPAITGLGQQRKYILDEDATPATFAESEYAQRITAAAMGLPIYKAILLDNKKRDPDLLNLTELELSTKYSAREFKAIENFVKDVLPFIPEHYIKSYQAMVDDGMQVIEKFRKSPYTPKDKFAEYNIALEQISGAILNNAMAGTLKQLLENKSLMSVFAGRDTVLAMFRIKQQEIQNSIGYVETAMNNLVKGLDEQQNNFEVLKRGASKIVNQSKNNVENLQSEIDSLKAEFKIRGAGRSKIAEEFIESPNGLDLKNTIGSSVDKANIVLRQKFFKDAEEDILALYNKDSAEKDELWTALKGKTADNDINITEYVDSLLNLKQQEIEQYGGIASVLKNKNSHLSYGRVTGFDLSEPIKFSSDIDIFVHTARHNALEKIDSQDLNNIAADLLNKEWVDEIDILKGNRRTNLKVNDGKATNEMETFSLTRTLENAEENANLSGMNRDDYVRLVLSMLKAPGEYAGQLNKEFNYSMNALEMHNLRKSLNQWSWNNRKIKPGPSKELYKLTNEVDNLFDAAGIPELEQANKFYKDYKRKWYEDFLGKKLLKDEFYSDDPILAMQTDPEEYLLSFFRANDPEVASKLFFKMFPKDQQDKFRVRLERVLGDSVSRDGYDGIFGGSRIKRNLKLAKFEQAKLISKEYADKLKDYFELIDKTSKYNEGEALRRARVGLDEKLKRYSKAFDEALKNSEVGQVDAKIDDLDSLVDHLFPRAGNPTYAREFALSDEQAEVITDLEKGVDQTVAEIKRATGELPSTDIAKIDELVSKLRTAQIEDITGQRFEIFLKDVLEIKNNEPLSKANEVMLDQLYDGILSTFIRRSLNVTSKRKAHLDYIHDRNLRNEFINAAESPKGRLVRRVQAHYTKAVLDESHIPLKSGPFQLANDFDEVTLMTAYNNAGSSLKRIDELLGREKTNNFENMLQNLIAIKGEFADEAGAALDSIPKALTIPAALSRLYSGFRGVVSWRYLASEQIVREHQRAKHMMFHKLMTDPEFMSNVNLVLSKQKMSTRQERKFVEDFMEIMKVSGARAVVYDPDAEDQVNYSPSSKQIVNALRDFWLIGPLFPDPKDLTQGDISYSTIEKPSGIVENILPIRQTRRSDSYRDILKGIDESKPATSIKPSSTLPNERRQQIRKILEGLD